MNRGISQKHMKKIMQRDNRTFYQRIEKSRKTDQTLGTIEKLQKIYGHRLIAF